LEGLIIKDNLEKITTSPVKGGFLGMFSALPCTYQYSPPSQNQLKLMMRDLGSGNCIICTYNLEENPGCPCYKPSGENSWAFIMPG